MFSHLWLLFKSWMNSCGFWNVSNQFHEGICQLIGLLIESKWTNNRAIKDMVIIREATNDVCFCHNLQSCISSITCLFQMMMADNFYAVHVKMKMFLIAFWQFFQVVCNFPIQRPPARGLFSWLKWWLIPPNEEELFPNEREAKRETSILYFFHWGPIYFVQIVTHH